MRWCVKVPMVCINHGQDVTLPFFVYQKFVPWVFRSLDGVISVSKATRLESIKRGMDPEKCIALPNGFSTEELNYNIPKEEARRLLTEALDFELNGQNMLLTVGRQVKRKGHEWFINKVLPLVKSDYIYVIIGDGPEFKKIKARAGKNVEMLGYQPFEILREHLRNIVSP
jgi:phosphatidyl-myo-inositol dimannoside synthase